MSDTNIILLKTELTLPVSFINRINVALERNEAADYQGKLLKGAAENTDQDVSVHISTVKSEIESSSSKSLTLNFSKLLFSFENGCHSCTLLTSESESVEFQDAEKQNYEDCGSSLDKDKPISRKSMENTGNISDVNIIKRRRGRPRKIYKTPTEKCSDIAIQPTAITSEQSKKVNICNLKTSQQQASNSSQCDVATEGNSRRYSLRGVKLNTAVMNAIRGETDMKATEDEVEIEGSEDDVDIDIDHSDGAENDDAKNFETDSDYDDGISDHERKRKKRKNINLKTYHKENISVKRKSVKLRYFHVKKKRVSKQCACKICDKKLIDYTRVYDHVKKMHTESSESEEYLKELTKLKRETCTVCGLEFEDRWKLGQHEDKEHSKLDCLECNKPFKNMNSYKVHVRTMHSKEGRKPGLCHLCPATFRSVGSLQQHIDEIHLGNKHVQCNICEKKFYNQSQLRRHSRIHGLDESKRMFCSICNKSFLFKHNLQRHMTAVHTTHTESFHCSYCGKGFGQQKGMISHVQLVHFNLFPFSCNLCKAIFARSVTLKDHMASFHKQTNFHIDKLPKNSIYNKSVEDLFYCSYCSIGFHNKTKLVVHMHTDHSDAFPYSCKTCKQGFLEKSYLIVHRLKAHGEWIQEDNDIVERQSGNISKIMQYISTKTGGTSKVLPVNTGDELTAEKVKATVVIPHIREDIAVDNQQVDEISFAVENSSGTQQEVDVASEQVVEVEEAGNQASSVIVEVESGTNTYRYLIETPDSLGDPTSVTVAQDIANLLLAAEQSIQEESFPDQNSQGVQQISLVIDNENAEVPAVAADSVTMTTEAPVQTISDNPEEVVETVAVIPEERDNMVEETSPSVMIVVDPVNDGGFVPDVCDGQGGVINTSQDVSTTDVKQVDAVTTCFSQEGQTRDNSQVGRAINSSHIGEATIIHQASGPTNLNHVGEGTVVNQVGGGTVVNQVGGATDVNQVDGGTIVNQVGEGTVVNQAGGATDDSGVIQIQVMDAEGNMEVMTVASDVAESHGVNILQLSGVETAVETDHSGQQELMDSAD